jgi:HEAT repeat protein
VPAPRLTRPGERVRAEAKNRGEATVVAECLGILQGRSYDPSFLSVLAGPAAAEVLAGKEGGLGGYWPRVWALRALLYLWDETAGAVVLAACEDESWRVREMAAKVIGRHRLDEGLEPLAGLVNDPVARVAKTSRRAVETILGARS